MAKKDTFTCEEWTLVRLAPSFVSVGISAADPSGLFFSIRETMAGSHETLERLTAYSSLELFSALGSDHSIPDLPDIDELLGDGSNEQQMLSFKNAALEQVKAAVATVAGKASPAETEAYRQLLIGVAHRAANAAKEGAFLGIGGVRVSDKEREFINAVIRAAGAG